MNWMCDEHPQGVIAGNVSAEVVEEYLDCEPRVGQIKALQLKYDPYTNQRSIPSNGAWNQLRVKRNKERYRDLNWFKSLQIVQREQHSEPTNVNQPGSMRGSIHQLTDSPKPSVAIYNERRMLCLMHF